MHTNICINAKLQQDKSYSQTYRPHIRNYCRLPSPFSFSQPTLPIRPTGQKASLSLPIRPYYELYKLIRRPMITAHKFPVISTNNRIFERKKYTEKYRSFSLSFLFSFHIFPFAFFFLSLKYFFPSRALPHFFFPLICLLHLFLSWVLFHLFYFIFLFVFSSVFFLFFLLIHFFKNYYKCPSFSFVCDSFLPFVLRFFLLNFDIFFLTRILLTSLLFLYKFLSIFLSFYAVFH